jgi:transcriptional regulator with XRE-family HTH domain
LNRFSLKELSIKVGISKSRLNEIELGHSYVWMHEIKLIAEILKVPEDDIIEGLLINYRPFPFVCKSIATIKQD